MLIRLNETQLADLNAKFDWHVEQYDDSDRIIGLGGRWRFKGVNHRITQLTHRNVELANKRVLELACLDGSTTVSLCEVGAIVTATDVRPMNLTRTFARLLAFGFNATLLLHDARQVWSLPRVDVLCHFGLFYHFADPVSHFRSLIKERVAPVIALETHTARDYGFTRKGECHGYKGVWIQEFGWKDALSGMDVESFWLDKSELLRLFQDHSLEVENIWDIDNAQNGPRSYWLLKCPSETL